MDMMTLMEQAIDKSASDIHIKTGNPPILRVDGELVRMDESVLGDADIESMLASIVSPKDIAKFAKLLELDCSYTIEGRARFRVNACKDDGDTRIVLRLIPLNIMTIDELELPPVIKEMVTQRQWVISCTCL